jgi:uncharacterized membrane protein YgdD (TMEM256/DUF423 family)
MQARTALFVGAAAMFVAVALGAFGAHALQASVGADRLAVWQTAVQYQSWHALALFGVGLLGLQRPDTRMLRWAAGAFAAGIVLFCGSLYALTLTGVRGLGAITPIGGVAFLAGWALLAMGVWRIRE